MGKDRKINYVAWTISAVVVIAVTFGLKIFNRFLERQNLEMYENITQMAGGKDSLMTILDIEEKQEKKEEEVILPNSKYLILHGKQADIWTAEMYKNNKESMKGIYPDLSIFLIEDHSRLGAVDTSAYYLVNIQEENRIWNGKTLLVNVSHLYSEYPSASVRKLTTIYGELTKESENGLIKVYTHPTYN